MIQFEQSFGAVLVVETSGLQVGFVCEKSSHVAEIFEEGCFAKTQLVFVAGQCYHFVQEISQTQYYDTGLLVHDLEESSDFESGHAEDVE